MFRAAASALLLSIACTPDDIAQEGTTSPEPGADPASEPGPDPDPDDPDPDDPDPDVDPDLPLPSDERPGSPGAPCLLDADCGPDTFCQLRICVAGCPDAVACGTDEVCDPHGRCVAVAAHAHHWLDMAAMRARQRR